MSEIEKLEEEKRKAWDAYEELREPADEARKKYNQACAALKDAQLYEKARKQVMRDLLKASGMKP